MSGKRRTVKEDVLKEAASKLRRLAQAGKVEDRLKARTLSDVAQGTVFEVVRWGKTQTSNGEACLLSAIETIKSPKGGTVRNPFQLMISGRFEEECAAKVPCVVYYGGMKDTKKGQKCHDLKFVKPDDKDVFRKDDEELIDPPSDSDDEVLFLKKDEKVKETKCAADHCPLCAVDGLECIGFCEYCEEHLPLNGSQCRCRVKKMFKF